MKVSIVLPPLDKPLTTAEELSEVYLEGMKGYPNTKCQPEIVDNIAEFRLSLTDFYECGVTRIVNKLTVIISIQQYMSGQFLLLLYTFKFKLVYISG